MPSPTQPATGRDVSPSLTSFAPRPVATEASMDDDLETLVQKYLPCKPEQQRNMILRIAQEAGVSEGTVKRWIRRNGARMNAEWTPPMRMRTKQLEPECEA